MFRDGNIENCVEDLTSIHKTMAHRYVCAGQAFLRIQTMRKHFERLIAIGDIHGCIHALNVLLEKIAPTASDRLVFLGDLIDQGRDSSAVLDRLIHLHQQCDVVLIKGNHEEMILAAHESESTLRYWENCGGVATLNSYRFGAVLADIPPEHWSLLESCQPYLETDEFLFTHANYLPDVPISQTDEYQLRWALFEPEEMGPSGIIVGRG